MSLLTTGDASLDRIVGGGIRPGSLIVVAGPPGSGKTILAQQLCFANAAAGRGKAVYYTTWSEPHDKLVAHLDTFSFFDPDALGEAVEFVHLPAIIGEEVDDAIGSATEEILREAFASRPSVVVVDSSKALHDIVDADRLRRAVYDLAGRVAHSGAVLVFVGEYGPEELRTEPEFAVADGILQLENESRGPIDRRWLRVLKMRGAETAQGRHSFRICPRGVEVFQRLETTLPANVAPLEGRIGFGIDRLDEMLGGGLPAGDSTVVLGPSGIGKTMLALHFSAAGVARGERCLHISFQETEDQLVEKMEALGWKLGDAVGDRLIVRHVPPVELDLDEVGAILRDELARGDVKRVVVDSLAELAFAARETERFPAYVWMLGGVARAAGATSVFTNELDALARTAESAGLSFLFNNVLLLRYVEVESELRRGVNVVKMRRSTHQMGLRDFRLEGDGLVVGELLEGVSGLLGWTALSGHDPTV